MDLVIKGGTVVTSGSSFAADVGVDKGKVVQIGGPMSGAKVIDATGKLVIPGGVDPHVHLTLSSPNPPGAPPRMAEDMYTGSIGAVAGGVTTIGNIISPLPDETIGLLDLLDRWEKEGQANSMIDFILHPVTNATPQEISEIPRAVARGQSSIKMFTTRPSFNERPADYIQALEVAGKNGVLTMIHCEDYALNTYFQRRLLAEEKTDISYYPASRPPYAEGVATARAIAMGKAAEAPVYIVHLSSSAALQETNRAKARGDKVYVEVRPIYLYLTRERFLEKDGAKYMGVPPLREKADVDDLWEGLRSGSVDVISTDHAPWMLAHKVDPALKIGTFRAGMANLETLMPMLYSEGVRKGRISLSRWIELISTNAAKLFGLYPQKGTIAIGSDADIVVWDPDKKRTIHSRDMHSVQDYDVFEGWDVQGWPTYTISRGEVVFDNGKVTGTKGRGKRVKRAPFSIL